MATPRTWPGWLRAAPYYSERILASSPSLEPISTTAGMHHERLDGSGYHRCSAAAAIPMAARILAVADAFAAMIRARPHRGSLSEDQASLQLTAEAEAWRFDHNATVAEMLQRADSEGMTAYHEAITPGNRALSDVTATSIRASSRFPTAVHPCGACGESLDIRQEPSEESGRTRSLIVCAHLCRVSL